MSSLSAQLSAINSANNSGGNGGGGRKKNNKKNVGSIISTNKRHTEAAGRGLHYSVQLGQATLLEENRTKFKASVLYETARDASDISLLTLWDNCFVALQQLEQYYPTLLSQYLVSCKDSLEVEDEDEESDDDTRNMDVGDDTNAQGGKKQDTIMKPSVRNLLYLLSSLYQYEPGGDDGGRNTKKARIFDCCLNIIEYLLRRYEIHSNTIYAEYLFISFLPHAELYPKMFGRLLQLIDFVGLGGHSAGAGTYLWLRPYSAASTKSNNQSVVVPTRVDLAQHCMNQLPILQQLLQYIQSIVLLSSKYGDNDDDGALYDCHRGISQILSWSTIIVIQGLYYLQNKTSNKKKKKSLSYSDMDQKKESILRTLLPSLIHSTSSKCNDYRNWGYTIISSLNETMNMSLSPQLLQDTLMESILNGAKSVIVIKTGDDASEDNEMNTTSTICNEENIEVLSSALITLMSLVWNPNYVQYQHSLSWMTVPPYDIQFLSAKNNKNNQQEQITDQLILSSSIVDTMYNAFDSSLISSAFSNLYSQYNINIIPFVSCLLCNTITRLTAATATDQTHVDFILKLLQNRKLQYMWEKNQLAECLTTKMIYQYCCNPTTDNEPNSVITSFFSQILQQLYGQYPKQCEQGMSRVIVHYNNQTPHYVKKNNKKIAILNNNKLKNLLSFNNSNGFMKHFLLTHDEEKVKKGRKKIKKDGNNKKENNKESVSLLLPSRVAIEHSAASVRLEALKNLLLLLSEEEKLESEDMVLENEESEEDEKGESLEECLLRRFCMDDDKEIITRIGTALTKKFQLHNDSSSIINACSNQNKKKYLNYLEMIYHSLYKWIEKARMAGNNFAASNKKKKRKHSDVDFKYDLEGNIKVIHHHLMITAHLLKGWFVDDEANIQDSISGMDIDGNDSYSNDDNNDDNGYDNNKINEKLNQFGGALVEVIVAHLNHSITYYNDTSNNIDAAQSAICFLMSDENDGDSNGNKKNEANIMERFITSNNTKKELLWTQVSPSYMTTENLESTDNVYDNTQVWLRYNCFWVIMKQMNSHLTKNARDQNAHLTILAKSVFKGCISALKSCGQVDDSQLELLQSSLSISTRIVAKSAINNIPNILLSLASSTSDSEKYTKAVLPSINFLCVNFSSLKQKKRTKIYKTSPLALLMETVLLSVEQSEVPSSTSTAKEKESYAIAIERIFGLSLEYVNSGSHSDGGTGNSLEVCLSIIPTLARLTLIEKASEIYQINKNDINKRIRISAINLVSSIAKYEMSDGKYTNKWKSLLDKVCLSVVDNKSSISMGVNNSTANSMYHQKYNINAISSFLSSIIYKEIHHKSMEKSNDNMKLRNLILFLIYSNATSSIDYDGIDIDDIIENEKSLLSFTKSTSNNASSYWLPFGTANGSYIASSLLLDTIELTGENTFPLSLRWKIIGWPMLKKTMAFLQQDPKQKQTSSVHQEPEICDSFIMLLESVVRMLKGVLIMDSVSFLRSAKNLISSDSSVTGTQPSSTIISMGPSSRTYGRARSYSFSKYDGVSAIESYPESMSDAIIAILDKYCTGDQYNQGNHTMLCRKLLVALMDNVLSSESWRQGIFRKLPEGIRRKIATQLLLIITRSNTISRDENKDLSTHVDKNQVEKIFHSLPLTSADITSLIQHQINSFEDTKNASCDGEHFVFAVTLIEEYIRINSKQLVSVIGFLDLVCIQFNLLEQFSSSSSTLSNVDDNNIDVDDLDFVQKSILVALSELMDLGGSNILGKTTSVSHSKNKQVSVWVHLLLALLGGNGDPSGDASIVSYRPCQTRHGNSTTLSLLTNLCSLYPTIAINSLLPAIVALISNCEAQMEASANSTTITNAIGSTFDAIVPVFCLHAVSAKLSLVHLFSTIISSVQSVSSDDRKTELLKLVVKALLKSSYSVPGENNISRTAKIESSSGALVACYLAASNGKESSTLATSSSPRLSSTANNTASEVLECIPPLQKVSSVLLMLQYTTDLIGSLRHDDGEQIIQYKSSTTFPSDSSILPRNEHIKLFALNGSSLNLANLDLVALKDVDQSKSKIKQKIRKVVKDMLVTINYTLQSDSVRKYIRKSNEPSGTKLCLKLWQDLLMIHSTTMVAASIKKNKGGKAQKMSKETEFWNTAVSIIGECLDYVQYQLPVPLFLASATSLFSEGETEELRSKAIRLIADRALEVQVQSKEANLFLDTVPLLVDLINAPSSDNGTTIKQSALIAIEHIAKANLKFSPSASKVIKKGSESKMIVGVFLPALSCCTNVLSKAYNSNLTSDSKLDFTNIESSSLQLICSDAICAATLIRATAPSCIQFLSKFMDPLIKFLSCANECVESKHSIGQVDEKLDQARMMQLCMLRALTAIAETMPQFLVPHLNSLLSPSALTSEMLRIGYREKTFPVRLASNALEEAISSKVPYRLFIPAVCKALLKCTSPTQYEVLFSLMKVSMETAPSGKTLFLHKTKLIKAVTTAYDYEGDYDGRLTIYKSANEVLMTLILKISEVELRSVYTELREWRGDLDKENSIKLARRRYAFWTISALLSEKLKTIFLPCLSMVTADVVKELELFVSRYCKKGIDIEEFSITSSLFIQPLLRCLECALRADAHEGGEWIRADDGRRYNSLVEPLGRLLQLNVDVGYVVPASKISGPISTPYNYIVHGDDSGVGCVINCLVVLAAAVGNEQQWKILNREVLDACSNEERLEVKRAGIMCLLALMKSLGEEYMVLLPECLPVLSELLEDTDEEVAGLAQDCVGLGEELIGESLEENLR